MTLELCGPSEYLRFGLSFFPLGYMTIMLFYALYIFLDQFTGWEKLECKWDQDGYCYLYRGNRYRGKVFSATSDLPFERNIFDKNIDHCYVKKKSPRRSRAKNGFDRYGTLSAMFLGAPLILGAIALLLPTCFRDQIMEMIFLFSIGAFAALFHVFVIRLVNLSVKLP